MKSYTRSKEYGNGVQLLEGFCFYRIQTAGYRENCACPVLKWISITFRWEPS